MSDFTITLFAENQIGMLNRISVIISRRRINIESLQVAASGLPGIHRFTIVVNDNEEAVRKLSSQLEKQIDIFKSFLNPASANRWLEHNLGILNSQTSPMPWQGPYDVEECEMEGER
ncbi:acetolactate synthase-1/3 small subunit [Larkinella arboricola]|uniref:acetolactate synthase n=1 Tax=Larkinella arboricola TaxID=643671 RepID=A0A327WL02_LARAB|nr:acetolactate synthase small subunit [Larkinella arboricola]RAJ90698.1 acetolactate synthase-1/3 small subunit [Larkinella arboricola]